jgi:4-azaleucine resistance transporter AzlC
MRPTPETNASGAPDASDTPRAAWLAGASSVAPFLAGTIPFGMVTGIATKAAGLSAEAAAAMTIMVFAGTAQIAALPLLAAGAPVLVILLTAFIVNLRFVIYSATVAPYFKHLPLRWKLLLGYFVTDTGFAMFIRKVADKPDWPQRHWFFLGGGMVIASVWCLSALVGIVAGTRVPPEWRLEFAATLAILALMAPVIRSRGEFAAAVIGGGVALAGAGLPMKLGLVLGAIAGIAGGALTDRAINREAR